MASLTNSANRKLYPQPQYRRSEDCALLLESVLRMHNGVRNAETAKSTNGKILKFSTVENGSPLGVRGLEDPVGDERAVAEEKLAWPISI